MSSDGSDMGISATRALDTILGGEPSPTEDEGESRETVRERVLAAVDSGREPTEYGDCADIVAGMVLRFFEAHPEALDWPIENTYEWRIPGGEWSPTVPQLPEGLDYGSVESRKVGPDLYGSVKTMYPRLEDLGITGFQWGWGANCARWICSAPAQPNPAIMELG